MPSGAAVFPDRAPAVVVGVGAHVEDQSILHDLPKQGLDAFGHWYRAGHFVFRCLARDDDAGKGASSKPRINLMCISCDFGCKLDELCAWRQLLVQLKNFGLFCGSDLRIASPLVLFQKNYNDYTVKEPTELTKALLSVLSVAPCSISAINYRHHINHETVLGEASCRIQSLPDCSIGLGNSGQTLPIPAEEWVVFESA